ncbi:tryptophan synthase beta chain 2, chloroplastic-like isoform X1 [Nicotiana tabacum]|uniref:Tryptophan synthase beta chain 2, chloroplastic-like isoform X1 n=1 Tax=Nicotiana tabacum TaxID=4097 RepID=A0AC58URE8_TOBAC
MACNIEVIFGQAKFATSGEPRLSYSRKWSGKFAIFSVATGPSQVTELQGKLAYHEKKRAIFSNEKFGIFGGKFVPETLISSLTKLDYEFNSALHDPQFQMELEVALRDYVGRETPLYFAERLTDHYKSKNRGKRPDIYLKREDLNHVGAHKINTAIAQTMLAKRMDCKNIIAATGAGQHGVATAAACAKLSLECTVFMGSLDMERQPSNVLLMKHLGAKVKSVKGSFKDAVSEGIRSWVNNLEISYLDVVSLKFFKIKNYVKNTISHNNL